MAKELHRWALLVEYDGSGFVGWQRQKNGVSVQETLEQALERLTGDGVRVLGAGRTDAGVHALGQVAAFSTSKRLSADNVVRGGNAHLPGEVRICGARPVEPEFNPRRDAVRRRYRYRLVCGAVAPALDRHSVAWVKAPVQWDVVRLALDRFRGAHDFGAFRSSRCGARRTKLTLERAELTVAERKPGGERGVLAEFEFECRSFLHNMVRLLVGAAMDAGRGRLSPEVLEKLLSEGRRGSHSIRTAPACGLCLMSVQYPGALGLWR